MSQPPLFLLPPLPPTLLYCRYLITITDFLNCLVFLLAVMAFKVRLNSIVKVIKKKQVTAADFSIFVKRLPKGV